jgi:hypothetical protein
MICVSSAVGATQARPLLTRAEVPLDQSVQDLLNGRFVERATCRRACNLATRVVIRPGVARRLGFTNVGHDKWIEIGTASGRLKANRPTNVTIHPTREARRLLARTKSGLQMIGFVEAAGAGNPSQRSSASWNVTCRRR